MSATKILQDYIFTSKYAKYRKQDKRRDTWTEAVVTVRDMMLKKYADKPEVHSDIIWAYQQMSKKRVLGSQRALQYAGEPVFKKNARAFNCTFSYADRPRFFQEFFWLLLCGCGCGFSVQKHHIAKLPPISDDKIRNANDLTKRPTKVFVIPDSIEGWADSIGVLLTSYWDIPTDPRFEEYIGCNVVFDYSLIRPKGSPLSSGVGKAPGPDGLRNSLEKIVLLLDNFIHNEILALSSSAKLRPIHIYDICMHISDAVLSGGVRRSATIVLFSPDDDEMLNAKIGNWMEHNKQRARSNNSVLLLKNHTTKEQFEKIMQSTKQWGEPGFVWSDSPEHGVNPCCEVSFFAYYPIDEDKFNDWKKNHLYDPIECDPNEIGLESCWHFCNLSTTNCSKLPGTTREEKIEVFLENVKAATIIGTLQAGFTNFEYLPEASQKLAEREALLGVSMTGMMDNYDIVCDPEIQRMAAKLVLDVNEDIAKKIGINLSARATVLKPEGTGTLVLGSSAHGCHPHHYIRYLRAIQANTTENVYQYFREHNPNACEKSLWSSNNTDDIVYFPIEVPDGAKTKNQIPAVELLETVKSIQINWITQGKREHLCLMPWLNHNVSNTITVRENEWEDVTDFIYNNREYFCGVSLVPDAADKDYPQAPNCAVYTPRQIVKEYGDAALWTSGLIEEGLKSFGNLWTACFAILDDDYVNNLKAKLSPDEYHLLDDSRKVRFWYRCRRFANRYFDGDYKKLTYCMKDVYNWKRWYDLRESMIEVDYTKLIENDDYTKPQEELACSGGSCLI